MTSDFSTARQQALLRAVTMGGRTYLNRRVNVHNAVANVTVRPDAAAALRAGGRRSRSRSDHPIVFTICIHLFNACARTSTSTCTKVAWWSAR
ncbi:hypothetical protein EON66_12480 [archaeon]|nr:MAG: hypothetical protein EON66_12480 [archaeon]